jgi:hypothetical protein
MDLMTQEAEDLFFNSLEGHRPREEPHRGARRQGFLFPAPAPEKQPLLMAH